MTVTETLSLMKTVQARIGELSSLRSEVSGTKSYYGGDTRKVVEPNYDVVAVDRKIVHLRRWLFEADARVKQSNAVTQVDIDKDEIGQLLSPIE